MKNKLIITLGLVGILAAGSWAADNLGSFTSATKNVQGSRWATARVATTTTSLASVTNLITSTPGFVGQVTWLPSSAASVMEIHTASATTGATAANELFVVTTNTQIGNPVFFNFHNTGGGLDATNGIVIVTKPAVTTSVDRVFISYDINR